VRVAIVSPEFPPDIGGIETYSFEFVKELARRGHEVTVFTVRHAPGEIDLPGIRVEPVLKLCYAIDRDRLSGCKVDVWHALNAAYAWVAAELPRGLVSVHGNDFLNPYLPVAQPNLQRVPAGWRWSHAVSRRLRPLWLRLTERAVRRSLAQARHVIANSRYTESALLRRIPACRGRTSVGLVGVASQFFDVARQPPQDGVLRLLTVSRLSEARKNVDRVLLALSRLKDRFAFRYTVVGDGYERKRLEGLASELRLADRVRFTGFITKEKLLDIYGHSDLLVLASGLTRDSHEGFGIVYLEAAASGVPSLAARLAGAVEAIDEGNSGMFVEGPTVDAITDALARFLSGETRFEVDACRAFARRFTWANVVDHAVQYY